MSDIKNHFPLVIYGNKTKELKKLESYFPLDVQTVVEPFAGSFAVIRYFYQDDKYNKIINDSDTALIDLYKKIATDSDSVVAIYDEMMQNPEHTNSKIIQQQLQASGSTKLLETFSIRGNFLLSRILEKKIRIKPLSEFLNKPNITLFNEDWRTIMDSHKDDPNAFIFLDPPYFNSFNMAYSEYKGANNQDKTIKDNSLMFIEMLTYLKTAKAKVMIIISETALTDYILCEFKKLTYPKTYGVTGKKTNHIMYTNFTIEIKN